MEMHERKVQLQELDNFISNARESVHAILNTLNWDVKTLRGQSAEMVTCPLNKEHYVPKHKLQKHIDSCSWRLEGYHEDDVPLPECSFTGGPSIVIDKERQTAVIKKALAQDPTLKTRISAEGIDDRPIPKTANRVISDFTMDERRILYEYVVQNTKAPPAVKLEDLEMLFKKEEKERPKTYLERLAAERDAKRRKVSKKVHTNRKSHIEILREVIKNQMELYEEYLKQQHPELRQEEDRNSDYDSHSLRREKRSPVRKREDSEYQEDNYRYRKEFHKRHSIYEESQNNFEYRSSRRSEYDRREESKSHRDRSSSYYKESGIEKRSESSHRKHTHEERDHRRHRDEIDRRSEMHESRRKRHRETSYEYDSHDQKQRERSGSYESKSRKNSESHSESKTKHKKKKHKKHKKHHKKSSRKSDDGENSNVEFSC